MPYRVEFMDARYEPVSVPEGANLSQVLTALNSPVLFGCRTGICGSCLVQVEEGFNTLSEAAPEEKEALRLYAPANAKARLACQVVLNCNICLKKIESA